MSSSNGPHDMAQAVPAWIQAMRDAAQKVIKTTDIEAIVQGQLEAAKKGNQQAIKFVFEQILGGGASMKGATFVQNNFSNGDKPGERDALTDEESHRREEVRRARIQKETGDAFRADAEIDPPFKTTGRR